LCAFLISPMVAIFPSQLILYDLITLMISLIEKNYAIQLNCSVQVPD
jgi:hypothetical protein